MGPQVSTPWSQELASCPYYEPYQSSPRPLPISVRSTLILYSHLRLDLTDYFFPLS
jgi:hypothetical protein